MTAYGTGRPVSDWSPVRLEQRSQAGRSGRTSCLSPAQTGRDDRATSTHSLSNYNSSFNNFNPPLPPVCFRRDDLPLPPPPPIEQKTATICLLQSSSVFFIGADKIACQTHPGSGS